MRLILVEYFEETTGITGIKPIIKCCKSVQGKVWLLCEVILRLEITQHLPATPELGKHIFIQSGGNSKPLRGIGYVASEEHVFFEPVLIEEDEEDVSPKEKGSDTDEEEMLEFIEEDEEDVNPRRRADEGSQ
ncbi:unnamed protein product [Cuscuta campestris]|uniref:Uncharacterized protein n=1 Tax=Cuscuta campestris TaxID=132261 RepID=A0A484L0H9_9ASTE|nr:unnamed protein product [Cuscuta campestris]